MKTNNIYIIILIFSLFSSCQQTEINIISHTDEYAEIFPDYNGVTIPVNIAPLNFTVMEEEGEYALSISGKGKRETFMAEDRNFNIPIGKWHSILEKNADNDIILTISRYTDKGWVAYKDMSIHVCAEKIEPYLTYRLIPPYEQWNRMGLYQRDLESFDQTPLFENKMTDYGCVNCHTFNQRNTKQLLFHSRVKGAGTAYIQKGIVSKLNTRTEETHGNMQYAYWHPLGRYVVASVNSTWENYYYHAQDRVEVYDSESDIYVYDMVKKEVFSNETLSSPQAFETFPTFSPDGKSLFFCTAEAIDSVAHHIEQLKYSLCRIDFDAEKQSFGTKVDTIYNARTEGRSISHPRISPDGRWMAVCLTDYGNFPVNHKDADLFIINMETREIQPLDGANSDRADSYHSWGGGSHWMVFSSRRIDGYYSRPYITYIDNDGKASKPFLLPQHNPHKFYIDQMMSYNLPELVDGKVQVSQHKIALTLNNRQGENMSFKK